MGANIMLHIPIDIVWIVVLNIFAVATTTRAMLDESRSWGFNAL